MSERSDPTERVVASIFCGRRTMTVRSRRAISPSNHALTTSSCSSARSWREVTTAQIRNRLSRSRNRRASIRYGRLRKTLSRCSFTNGSGKRVNMMYPVDNTFWTKLKAFVEYEPVSSIDPELRGVLASIGIVKGQLFNPSRQQQELLQKAVETAPKMILATRQLGRPDG